MRPFNSCCFCFSLRTACIIIGFIGIVWSVLILILAFTSFVKFNLIDANVSPIATKIIIVFNTLVWMTISVLLILGTLKEKGKFLIPWLIVSLCLLFGSVISIIYSTIIEFDRKHYTTAVLTLLASLLMLMFFVYLWLVVYSFYIKIKNGHTPSVI